jgi:membrane protease YdiL (CAAX protease family)
VLEKAVQNWQTFMRVNKNQLLLAVLVSLVAVKEEITFRLFIQTQLECWLRRTNWAAGWAILATSALWTLGHAGALEPNWVKFAQIFPMGIVLGIMRRRWGVTPCIFVHVVLNFFGVLLLQDLVLTGPAQ